MITKEMLDYLALFTKAELIWALKIYDALKTNENHNWSGVSKTVALIAVLKIIVENNFDIMEVKKLMVEIPKWKQK